MSYMNVTDSTFLHVRHEINSFLLQDDVRYTFLQM